MIVDKNKTLLKPLPLGMLLGFLGMSMGSLFASPPTPPITPTTAVTSATQPTIATSTTQPAAPKPTLATKPKSDEEITLAFLKQNELEVYQDALTLREKDPVKYAELLKEFIPETKRLIDLQKKYPPLFALVIEDRRLAYRALQIAKSLQDVNLSSEAKGTFSAELTTIVSKQFAVRQQKRQMELSGQEKKLADLQRRLDDLKHELENREKNKDSLINQRVSDLLKNNPRVEW